MRDEQRTLHDIAWVLSLKNSTLSEWNHLFDNQLTALHIPDQRGKAGKVSAELVKQVVQAALEERGAGRRIRIKSFTRNLAGQGIVLSSKTVADILIANDCYTDNINVLRYHCVYVLF